MSREHQSSSTSQQSHPRSSKKPGDGFSNQVDHSVLAEGLAGSMFSADFIALDTFAAGSIAKNPHGYRPALIPAQLSALQNTVGNRAVSDFLNTSRPSLLRRKVEPRAPAAWIQRTPDGEPIWNMPFNRGQASNHEQGREGLLYIFVQLDNVQGMIGEGEEVDPETRQQLRLFFDELRDYTQILSADGPLTESEARNLNSYGQEVEGFVNTQIAQARRRLQQSVAPIAEIRVQDTTQLEDDLTEQLHYAFIEGSTDRLETIQDAMEKVKDFNERVQQVAHYGSEIASRIRMARTAEALSTIASGAEQLGEVVNRIHQVITAARALATITGLDNQAVGETQNSINQFEQGLAAIDIAMSFADAIPLIGSLWSNYYYPAAQACIRMLRVIARATEREARDLATFEWSTPGRPAGDVAPPIPRGLARFFPGGQPILDFMYQVMRNGSPEVTPTVEQFFLQHIELFNVGREGREQMEATGPRWYNPFSWLEENHIPNLLEWVQDHRERVWAMLYGNLPVPR